jgi:hypothetical protein
MTIKDNNGLVWRKGVSDIWWYENPQTGDVYRRDGTGNLWKMEISSRQIYLKPAGAAQRWQPATQTPLQCFGKDRVNEEIEYTRILMLQMGLAASQQQQQQQQQQRQQTSSSNLSTSSSSSVLSCASVMNDTTAFRPAAANNANDFAQTTIPVARSCGIATNSRIAPQMARSTSIDAAETTIVHPFGPAPAYSTKESDARLSTIVNPSENAGVRSMNKNPNAMISAAVNGTMSAPGITSVQNKAAWNTAAYVR